MRKQQDKKQENIIIHKADNFNLTCREKDVFKLILEGKTNEEIATKLFISVNTAKKHLSHIFNKTEVHNRTELASIVYK